MMAAYIRMCAEAELPVRPRADGEGEELYAIEVLDMFGKCVVAGVTFAEGLQIGVLSR